MKKFIDEKFILLLFIIIVFIIIYYNKYSIIDSKKSFESYVINNNYINKESALIQNQIVIKNLKIVIFKYNGESLQYAVFQKGLNRKYSFVLTSKVYNVSCKSFIDKIQNNYYLISIGYNAQNNSCISTMLSPLLYPTKTHNEIFNIKNEQYFIKYKILTNQFKENYSVLDWKIEN